MKQEEAEKRDEEEKTELGLRKEAGVATLEVGLSWGDRGLDQSQGAPFCSCSSVRTHYEK